MSEEEMVELLCRGQTRLFWLFLHYIRKVLFSKTEDYFLTFVHYRFKLKVDKGNCCKLLVLIGRENIRLKANREAFENLVELIRFCIKPKKK